MKSRKGLLRVCALAVLASLAASGVRAENLVLTTQLFTGSESDDFSFNAPGPGVLSLQLTDLKWPSSSNLMLSATTTQSVLGTLNRSGSLSFNISGPGSFYAHVFGQALGSLKLGAYSLCVTFDPMAPPVPLPGSGPLLLGGMALLLWFARRRSREAGASSLAQVCP